LSLAEALACIGGQVGQNGDLAFALEAALLVDRIHRENAHIFENNPFWRSRVRGRLGHIVNTRLNQAMGQGRGYAGLDEVERCDTGYFARRKILGWQRMTLHRE
jgi:hypothetical protein